jgi:hypothetical protein
MRKLFFGFPFSLLLLPPIARATCLDIDDIKFEAIGATSLLALHGGLNIAIVHIYGNTYDA